MQYSPRAVQNRPVRRWIKRQNTLNGWVPRQGESVVRRALRAHVHWLALEREISCLEFGRRHDAGIQHRRAETLEILVHEKQRLVLVDRAANRIAELVAQERIVVSVPGKEILCGSHRVPPEPV